MYISLSTKVCAGFLTNVGLTISWKDEAHGRDLALEFANISGASEAWYFFNFSICCLRETICQIQYNLSNEEVKESESDYLMPEPNFENLGNIGEDINNAANFHNRKAQIIQQCISNNVLCRYFLRLISLLLKM